MIVRAAVESDAGAIASIYNHFVTETVVSFEEEPLTVDAMRDRIECIRRTHPCYVAEIEERVLGFAYAGPWNARPAYGFTAETTVYVKNDHHRLGIGSALYEALLGDLRDRGMHAAIGIIALPNPGSVALHEQFGFRRVGLLNAVGRKFERWIDVGFWQLSL